MPRWVALLLTAVVCSTAGRVAGAELTAAIVTEQLVARGATWHYLPGRAEPAGNALDWTQPGFDDGAWSTGPAGIGYGDGDDATVLSDMRDRYCTVYARARFEISDPERVAVLRLGIDYDDGFIAFINGVEIARANAGTPGTFPAHDDLATGSHEAETARSFAIAGAASFLVAGTNVLAVVGLNDDLSSSDFSLHPELSAGGVLAEGCAGDFYVAKGNVHIAGTASPGTSTVRVNGAGALFDAAQGAWSYQATVSDGAASFTAEALDGTGAVIASATLQAIAVQPLSGELAADVSLSASDNPFLVIGELTVPASRRLSIDAGCEFMLAPGIGMTIGGEVRAVGTPERPVRFTRVPCRENWGFFSFEAAAGWNTFRFCEWSFGGGDPGCLTLEDSSLELHGCTLRDIDGEGVHAVGCTTRIRACLIERTNEALSLDNGDTVVEFCTVRDTVGKSDLIDVNGTDETPPSRIAFNDISGTTDDGIDADGGTIVIEGNVIHGCGDQAMSLVGAGTSTVRYNICYANGHGLSVKDSNVCTADHNTFALNTVTGVRAIEKTSGRGGGVITLKNSIVWGNAAALVVEENGSIDAAYSDAEGALVPGAGNINADPRFTDAAGADFTLLADSPCLGAASDGTAMGALPMPAPPRVYARGDANGDLRRDVADAVTILAFLFEHDAAPICREVADANADGRLDLSDAICVLLTLFAGRPVPAPEEVLCTG